MRFGDRYTSEVRTGGYCYLVFHYNASSVEEAQSLSVNWNAKYKGFSTSGSITNDIRSQIDVSRMTLHASTLGLEGAVPFVRTTGDNQTDVDKILAYFDGFESALSAQAQQAGEATGAVVGYDTSPIVNANGAPTEIPSTISAFYSLRKIIRLRDAASKRLEDVEQTRQIIEGAIATPSAIDEKRDELTDQIDQLDEAADRILQGENNVAVPFAYDEIVKVPAAWLPLNQTPYTTWNVYHTGQLQDVLPQEAAGKLVTLVCETTGSCNGELVSSLYVVATKNGVIVKERESPMAKQSYGVGIKFIFQFVAPVGEDTQISVDWRIHSNTVSAPSVSVGVFF